MTAVSSKDAVSRAKAEMMTLYSDDTLQQLALEELELVTKDERQAWAVTLGFQRRRELALAPGGSALDRLVRQNDLVENRVYKTVYIDAETGEFMKMDMRLIQ